jgi:two-component system, OmpR family, phosphate regulon sensor histidine kinase PhoR
MAWWFIRSAKLLGILFIGGLSGYLVGMLFKFPALGIVLGNFFAATLIVLRDSLRGDALMAWLRDPLAAQTPLSAGFWGELAYRIDRALRSREQVAQRERERLQQFLSAMDASPNGVLLLDSGDHIEWCNSVAAQHFGLDTIRDKNQRVTNLVRMPAFVVHLQSRQFEGAVVFPGPLGRITLSVLVRPYGEGAKLVLSQDITERERTEAMRRDFVANVSHEIRTPLTVVAGFIETLTDLPLTEVERARVLDLMARQTDRMQSLVADLLTLATLEGSPYPTTERWTDVARLFQQAGDDARALSDGKHVIGTLGGGDAQFCGSETELHSAVTNLLNNAVRYTPAGGSITLRWHWRADGGAEITVADSGIGIAAEHLPRLTERFYRVDGSRSRDTGGTGLGLSIVKHVAHRHGGEIDVTSELGKGSTFRLTLPPVRLRRALSAADVPAPSGVLG